MREVLPYDALVFAGGGCRCFWQLGFLESVTREFDLAPRQAAAVSAGAAMACAFFVARSEEVCNYFHRIIEANERNIYPRNLFRKERVFPHEAMYRDTIRECMDEGSLRRLQAGPEIRVLLTRLPRFLGATAGVATAFLAYEAEKVFSPSVHPKLASRLGFRPEVVSLQSCPTAEAVADLILQSSCTPPMTRVHWRDGAPVLDGGLVDNVPVAALADGAREVLVLLSRRYPNEVVPKREGYTYVQPSAPVPVEKWDYTSPARVRATIELGQRDGNAFVEDWRSSHAAPSRVS